MSMLGMLGNLFNKPFICKECQSQNITPDFFTRKIVKKRPANDPILVDYIPITEKIDKYGKPLEDRFVVNVNDMTIIEYKCFNNHIIK